MFGKDKNAKAIFVVAIFIFLILYFGTAIYTRKKMMGIYHSAIEKISDGDYQNAIDMLNELGDYQDSLIYIEKAKMNIDYEKAEQLYEEGAYEEARKAFLKLGDFLDSEIYLQDIDNIIQEQNEKEELYNNAYKNYESKEFELALQAFMELEDYKNSEQMIQNCNQILRRQELSNVISAGIRSSGGISEDGKVFFSGEDIREKEIIEKWSDIISISIMGEFAMGLKEDGKVVTAKNSSSSYYIDTSDWSDIIAIAAGQQYIVGLRADGTVTAQGHNGDGQAEVESWNNIVMIDAGWRHTVGVDIDGNIYIAGYHSDTQLNEIEQQQDKWSDIIAVSAGGGGKNYRGDGHTVGLKKDGTVVAVGDNSEGQCNVGDWKDIVAISAGDFHTVGLTSEGKVVSTLTSGDSYETINNWENIVAVSAGYGFTLGVKEDGTVVSAGYDQDEQRNTENWENIRIWK